MPSIDPSAIKPTTPTAVVICIEMPGFVKRPVPEQLKLRESLHQRLTQALRPIRQKDRIVLDTGSGAAIALFGSPSLALAVTSVLCGAPSADKNNHSLRAVLTVGPIQALSLENGEVQVAGDSLDVAERTLALPAAEQVLATRAFTDILCREAPGCAAALKSLGKVTDDQVREHELYSLALTHPNVAALGGGKTRAAQGWWSTPRAAFASVAVASAALLWSGFADFGQAPASNKKPSVATAAQAIEAAESVTPTLLETQIPTIDLAVPQVNDIDFLPVPPYRVDYKGGAVQRETGTRHKTAVAHVRPALESGVPVSEVHIETRDLRSKNTAGHGKVTLSIAPWGEVLIDGTSVGISPPLTELELSPGAHYVEVRNGGLAPVLKRIELRANETLKIRHRFADAR